MANLKKTRIIVYIPRGFAIALKTIAAMTGEGVSEIAKRLLADGIKSEGSALLVMNKFLEYGLDRDKLPPAIVQELTQWDSDRRNNAYSDIDVDLELGDEQM